MEDEKIKKSLVEIICNANGFRYKGEIIEETDSTITINDERDGVVDFPRISIIVKRGFQK